MNSSRLLLAFAFVALAILAVTPEVRSDPCCRPQYSNGHLICADCMTPDNVYCGVRGMGGCDKKGCNCEGGCIKPKPKKKCGWVP